MIVLLETQNPLIPIGIGPFIADQSSFRNDYLASLRKVLEFDLNHNGMTKTLDLDGSTMSSPLKFDQALQAADWKGAYYALKILVHDKKLKVRLLTSNVEEIKQLDGWELKGNLAQDRRAMHKVADAIHKALFDKEGIASTHILYTVKTPIGNKWNSEVWQADYDGENAQPLTRDSGYAVTPTYMPPKKGYACGGFFYVSYKNGQPKIFMQSLGEKKSRRLSYLNGNQLMPAISPTRDKIALISDVTGNPDLFIIPFDPDNGSVGKPYQIFSTHRATQGTPTFSPDGKQIAFVSNKDGSPRIYCMPVPKPGTSLKNVKAVLLTKLNSESTAPSWSPDGTKIAYCAMTKGTRQIWIYDLEKNREKQVTQGPGNKENPAWAPNSLHLMYNCSNGKKGCDLYLINLNQPDAVKITSGIGEKHYPSWEPVSHQS